MLDYVLYKSLATLTEGNLSLAEDVYDYMYQPPAL